MGNFVNSILKIDFNFRKVETAPKKSVRPFSQDATDNKYRNAHTEKEDFGFADVIENEVDNKAVVNGSKPVSWYRNVVELRKKAEQYKV